MLASKRVLRMGFEPGIIYALDLRMRFTDYLQQIEVLAKEVLPRVQATAGAAAR